MPVLNAADLLTAWEEGMSQHPIQRALTLLARAWPERSWDEWARATIGERDRYLLKLREELFGPSLEAVAICPACGERLELAFKTGDLSTPARDSASIAEGRQLQTEGYEVKFRLPTSADLLEIASVPAADARANLLERCIAAESNGEPVRPVSLPDRVMNALLESMAEADPQAEVRIFLDCPSCLHRWSMVFDVLSYLWGEIEDWARRLMLDVHVLASAYGWSEREIIGMSSRRRRIYLEMAGA